MQSITSILLSQTALHWAAKKGNIDLIKMFGDAGVEVNTKSVRRYIPYVV